VIVTENVGDLPTAALSPLGVEAVRLDEFPLEQFDLNVAVTSVQVVSDQAHAMCRPPATENQLLGRFARSGAHRLAAAVEAARYSPGASGPDREDSGH
jgi:hypothetical protein